MRYFLLPRANSLAFVPRTGSTAWSQAILDKFYPNLKSIQDSMIVPEGGSGTAGAQFIIPSSSNPLGTVHIVLRDPIERFRSGFSRAAQGRSVDQVIADLIIGKPANVHIRSVTDQFGNMEGFHLYKWERDLVALAAAIGLDSVPAAANESVPVEKPTLTSEQMAKLTEYYADDITMYNSIFRPGFQVRNAQNTMKLGLHMSQPQSSQPKKKMRRLPPPVSAVKP